MENGKRKSKIKNRKKIENRNRKMIVEITKYKNEK